MTSPPDTDKSDASLRGSAATMHAQSSTWLPIALGLLPWPAAWIGLFLFRNVWAAFFLYHALCLIGWAFARAPLPPLPTPVWLRRQWLGLAGLCLGVNVGVYLLAGLFTTLIAPDHLKTTLRSINAGGGITGDAILFLYFATANPVLEELFWRGTVHGRLRFARWPASWCIAVSGVLFGAWHWLPVSLLLPKSVAAIAVVGIIVIGMLLAAFYERTRNLLPGMLLHALGADVPILIALWVDVLAKR